MGILHSWRSRRSARNRRKAASRRIKAKIEQVGSALTLSDVEVRMIGPMEDAEMHSIVARAVKLAQRRGASVVLSGWTPVSTDASGKIIGEIRLRSVARP